MRAKNMSLPFLTRSSGHTLDSNQHSKALCTLFAFHVRAFAVIKKIYILITEELKVCKDAVVGKSSYFSLLVGTEEKLKNPQSV